MAPGRLLGGSGCRSSLPSTQGAAFASSLAPRQRNPLAAHHAESPTWNVPLRPIFSCAQLPQYAPGRRGYLGATSAGPSDELPSRSATAGAVPWGCEGCRPAAPCNR